MITTKVFHIWLLDYSFEDHVSTQSLPFYCKKRPLKKKFARLLDTVR